MSLTRLIAKAYQVVLNHPVLWIFGLFLTSGFNIHWLWFHERAPYVSELPMRWSASIEGHPGRIIALVAGAIFTIAVGVLINSLAKTLLVLHVCHALGIKRVKPGWRRASDALPSEPLPQETKFGVHTSLLRESKFYVPSVAAITVTTVGLTVLGALVLFVPPINWLAPGQFQTGFMFLAVLIFLLLVFTVSCLNVFASFFVILYQKDYRTGINLATDLMVSRWQAVLGFVLLLMTLYAFSLAAATGLLFVSQHLVSVELGWVGGLRLLFGSISQAVTWSLVSLVLLVWLGILNSFFNTALLLLFTELVKPERDALAQAELKASVPHS